MPSTTKSPKRSSLRRSKWHRRIVAEQGCVVEGVDADAAEVEREDPYSGFGVGIGASAAPVTPLNTFGPESCITLTGSTTKGLWGVQGSVGVDENMDWGGSVAPTFGIGTPSAFFNFHPTC